MTRFGPGEQPFLDLVASGNLDVTLTVYSPGATAGTVGNPVDFTAWTGFHAHLLPAYVGEACGASEVSTDTNFGRVELSCVVEGDPTLGTLRLRGNANFLYALQNIGVRGGVWDLAGYDGGGILRSLVIDGRFSLTWAATVPGSAQYADPDLITYDRTRYECPAPEGAA